MIRITDHKTELKCPDTLKTSTALQSQFFIDEDNCWWVSCHTCGWDHLLDEMLKK